MSQTVNLSARPAGFTIARHAPYTLVAVEEAAARLKSWAVIMGVPVTGRPFIRLHSDLSASVHLPVGRALDTSREDGITAGCISEGAVVECREIPFDTIRDEAASAKASIPETSEVVGPVEYHAGCDGLRSGTLMVPIQRVGAASAA